MAETRRLAVIDTITDLRPIPNADAIVAARIRGWEVVVRLGEFAVGDRCVYFEVDSLLDVTDPRFAFLAPRGVRTDAAGRTGHVLKTARLRGQFSQGLALAVSAFPELGEVGDDRVGEDVTDVLHVTLWDPPLPVELAGLIHGLRPGWIPATDEERLQNVPGLLTDTGARGGPGAWVATEKIDGTSTTVWVDGDRDGVCSRNLDLVETPTQTMWRLSRELRLHALLRATYPGCRVAVQGETYGAGVQGNPLKLLGQHLAVFTARVDGVELPRASWPEELRALSVPVHDLPFPNTLEQALTQVDALVSKLAPYPAEGLVWRRSDTATVVLDGVPVRASVKVVSNRYLLKHDR
jgi:RNA ligase (TIGR02306 family)